MALSKTMRPYEEFPAGEVEEATENSPLLASSISSDSEEKRVPTSQIWKQETRTIVQYSSPIVLTLFLQYSLTVSSVFAVGHLGQRELGAVSVANMTAVISGYAVYQGLSTSLDTLCPQAYGLGKKQLVGLHLQRLLLLLSIVTIPIGVIWLVAGDLFIFILPAEDLETAILAGRYLRILLFGAPGFAFFEAGKRFLQAQGLFRASLYVLLIAAPFNIFLNWLLVWKLGLGFIGAPMAVAITHNLLPMLLFLYVFLVAGKECWQPLSWEIFYNWKPMLYLAIPSLFAIETECLSWEILILVTSYLGSADLAAQSALSSIVNVTWQVFLSASIASNTRIANLVGAGLTRRARIATGVSLCIALIVGLVTLVALFSLRHWIPDLFTGDGQVYTLIENILPVCAVLQLSDAVAACCNAVLRAIGRPEIGCYIPLFCYFVLALPIGVSLAFCTPLKLIGLWISMGGGLSLVAIAELIFISRIDWQRAVREALKRSEHHT